MAQRTLFEGTEQAISARCGHACHAVDPNHSQLKLQVAVVHGRYVAPHHGKGKEIRTVIGLPAVSLNERNTPIANYCSLLL